MRHTLKDYLEVYGASKIQIVFGQHLVNIDTEVEGSFKLIKALENYRYDFLKWDPDHKYLRLQH